MTGTGTRQGSMPSIRALEGCAEQHLAAYTDPDGGRAFRTYDQLGDPDTLTPLDCLAPALLSISINYRQVVPLFRPTGPGATLLSAMQAVLDHPASATEDFLDTDLSASGTAWSAVEAALRTCRTDGKVRWLKEVAITKILHRKRPALVPIFDRRVYSFYFGRKPGLGGGPARTLWPVLQADLAANRALLEKLAAPVTTVDGRPISLPRTADIVIWEHQTRCPS